MLCEKRIHMDLQMEPAFVSKYGEPGLAFSKESVLFSVLKDTYSISKFCLSLDEM